MAATVIPGQPRRWGNESTNFYCRSYTVTPGIASKQKVYRCPDNQYANSGHFHNGTKALNLNPPLDQYGTPSAYKLRAMDQHVPKAMTTAGVNCAMPVDHTVNLYQSHHQKYHNYAMAAPPLQHAPSEVVGGDAAVVRSLNQAFYTTSYQSDISNTAGQRSRPNSANSSRTALHADLSTPSLCENLDTRRMARTRPVRVKSAPPLRAPPTIALMPHPPTTLPPSHPPALTRRRSFTASTQYPSRGEMLKSIFMVFPSPEPQAVSRRALRPSSAVSLRAGKIPHLRN